MQGEIISTAEKDVYPHPKHDRFFLRDVVTADNNPAVSVHRGQIEPGGEIFPHTHDGQAETFYILAGEAVCTMGAEKQVVGPGQCCVAPSGVVHGLKNEGDVPVDLLAIFTPPLK